MWLAKYWLPLGLRKIGRGRVGPLGTAVEAGEDQEVSCGAELCGRSVVQGEVAGAEQ